ncbi:MAG: L-lactate dehydrogenase [Oscillospiraceae bacterium]|nr:L-lactate dehydrogenase [Oscillospiraceae bacterium]
MNKITVVGAGSVGSTIAYSLVVMGIASEIVMIDINDEKARGEAMDIKQGVPFSHPASIYAGEYADAVDSNIVIITSGVARKPGQSRLDLAQTNVNMLKVVAKEIVRYAPNAIYIIVSNPVDVLTYVFHKISGIPEEHIIGSGTILDTARLRARVAEYYDINEKNVHAYVLGEHGDTSFVPWSIAHISNVPVRDYKNAIHNGGDYPDIDFEEVENYVRKSGATVIQRKGATFYAVTMAVCHLCKCLLSGIDTTLTVSTMLHGEYGIEDVCLSLLTIVGKKGSNGKILLPLNDEEVKALHKSAECLKAIINSIEM